MILLINTATHISFVGLADEKRIIKKKIWEANLRQSEELLPIIEKIVGKSKIDGIIVVTGPGSYTGLRVGVATANALVYGWEVPVVGVDRFDIRKQKIENRNRNLVIILENISDLVYAQVESSKQNVERIVATLEELCEKITKPCYFVGQIGNEQEKIIRDKLGNKVLDIKISDDFDGNVLENLLKIGSERLKNEKQNNLVMPYYLREPHITKSKK